MPRERGLHRHVERIEIANFADDQHVRIVAQQTAQRLFETHLVRRIHLHLRDPGDLVFHGIFHRDDVQRRAAEQAADGGVERGGLAAAGGAGEQHQPVWLREHMLHRGQIAKVHAQLFQRQHLILRGKETERHALAVFGRERGHAHVDGVRSLRGAKLVGEGPVLRGAAFGDVHPGEHLQAAGQRGMRRDGQLPVILQHPIHAQADAHFVPRGIDVNVGRLPHHRRAQQFLAQRDGVVGRGLRGVHARAHHAASAPIAIHPRERALESLRFHAHRHRLAAGEAGDGLQRGRVIQIGAGDIHAALQRGKGQHPPAQRERDGNAQRPRGIDAHLIEIDGDFRGAHGFPPAGPAPGLERRRSRFTRSRRMDTLRAIASAVASLIRPATSNRARSCSSVCMPSELPASMVE